MKQIALFLLLYLFCFKVHSQSIATGVVKDEAGKPLLAAFVQEFNTKPASATYTDSTGSFSLSVGSFPKLLISCKGYNDTLVNATNNKSLLIVLSKGKIKKQTGDVANSNDNSLINNNLVQDAVSTQSGVNNNYVYGGGTRNYTGSLMPVFSQKEETKGSRYLFNKWVGGSVVNADNSIFNNPAYLYNYDKMEGGLLMTQDKLSAIEVDKAKIKSFTIFVDKDNPLVFERVSSIDDSPFAEVIAAGNKYHIYKVTKTKFVKANYQTNGITTSGNPFDEYIDEDSYFVLNLQINQMQKILLKKKSIKEVFASEGKKLDSFLSDNSNETINGNYLKLLGDYLNN